jgi:virginiamycin B lyase
VAGPDGALWFTEYNSSKVARITTAGAVSEFVTGITPGVCFGAIAAGPDGSLWVAMSNLPDGSGPILRFNTAGAITGSFATPEPASCAASMTPGPDGALWTGQLVLVGDTIGRLTTAGVFTDEFNIPRGGGPEPLGITTGPDGALWFTEYAAFRIGTVTTSGVFTEFPLPGVSPTGQWRIHWFGDSFRALRHHCRT